MWVEMIRSVISSSTAACHPPREDVSWNVKIKKIPLSISKVILLVRMWVEISLETVDFLLLLVILLVRMWVEISAVFVNTIDNPVILLVRMWVEISVNYLDRYQKIVILLVRMRVEISEKKLLSYTQKSSSSWGCELKWSGLSFLPALLHVILLVRMWVEITSAGHFRSWNCRVILLVRMWVEMLTGIWDWLLR